MMKEDRTEWQKEHDRIIKEIYETGLVDSLFEDGEWERTWNAKE